MRFICKVLRPITPSTQLINIKYHQSFTGLTIRVKVKNTYKPCQETCVCGVTILNVLRGTIVIELV